MLGHRGVRLGITYPEITEMQARAIFEAAAQLNKEGLKVVPEVMIPLVGLVKELKDQKTIVDRVAGAVMKEQGVKFKYLVGTMIEVPRGAVTADQIATEAQFFSFGTNDLTQLTFGFSRDDAGKFLGVYQERKILERDPFQSIDTVGVGQLVAMACEKGRKTRPDLKLGICGEHGGDPSSVHFFHTVGLDYVSASPYRVPVARLAAAHAAHVSEGRRLSRFESGSVGLGRVAVGLLATCPNRAPTWPNRTATWPQPGQLVITVFVHRNGRTEALQELDPALLQPGSGAKVWVDLAGASQSELRILSDVFHFHPLAVEDAVAALHHPKIEAYNGYLYLILHGIDYQKSRDEESFITHDTDFFLGPNYLVTIHDGQTRSITGIQDVCGRNDHVLGEGPGALMHRIIDRMVDNYRPEIEQLEKWLDELEREVFDVPKKETVREILSVKQDVTALRRISTPQRDAIGTARAPRVPDHPGGADLPVPRRLRQPRPDRRRGADLPGSDHQPARRALLECLEPPERDHARAHGHHRDRLAAHAGGRHLRHEHEAAAGRDRVGSAAVLVAGRRHGRDGRHHAGVLQEEALALNGCAELTFD